MINKRFLTIIAVLFLALITTASFAVQTTKYFGEVDNADGDQHDPVFLRQNETAGTPVKLKVTVCEDHAYKFKEGTGFGFPTDESQKIDIIIDLIDANGNIANKEALASSSFIMINLSFTESGSVNNSCASMSPVVVLAELGAQTFIYNTEAENVSITATSGDYISSDPVPVTFTTPASVVGKVVIPANVPVITLMGQLIDNTNDEISLFQVFPVQTGVTEYDFYFAGMPAGNYRLQIMPYHNKAAQNTGNHILPLCGTEPPLNSINVVAEQETNVGTINMTLSDRGGVEGTISIQGRTQGDLSNTLAVISAVPQFEDACNPPADITDSLTNIAETAEGSFYRLTNVQAGTYTIFVYIQDNSTQEFKWMKQGTVTVSDNSFYTLDLTAEPFTGMYAMNTSTYHTLLYVSPVDKVIANIENPNLKWKNELTKDPAVPVGANLNSTYYNIEVKNRCGTTYYEHVEYPHDGTLQEQEIQYGSSAPGRTIAGPVYLDVPDFYTWSVEGVDKKFSQQFESDTNGWSFLGLSLIAGQTPPASSSVSGLQINCTNNTSNFGFWQSPQSEIYHESNTLYRVRYMVSTPNADQIVAPQFRCRANSSSFSQYDFLNILSFASAEASPTSEPFAYDLYFVPAPQDRYSTLAFDVINIDPNDKADAQMTLGEVIIDRISLDSLKKKETIAHYTFDTSAEGWLSGGLTSNSYGNGALNMQVNGVVGNFGFWSNPSDRVPFESYKMYKGTFRMKSDTTKQNCPEMRFRFGAADQQSQMVQGISSVEEGIQSADSVGNTYTLYFYPPQYSPDQPGFFTSVDAIYINPSDTPNTTVSLDECTIERFDVPLTD